MRTNELGTDALVELNPALTAFLHDAEERGSVGTAELDVLQVEQDLDEDALDALKAALVAADVEIEEAARRRRGGRPRPRLGRCRTDACSCS